MKKLVFLFTTLLFISPLTFAQEPKVNLSPAQVDFKQQAVKVSSDEKTITLKNSGQADLTNIKISFSGDNKGDFALAKTSNCGTKLAAGENCQINVTFKPTAGDARQADLVVKSNAASSPDEVALKGTGVEQPAVSLKPASLNFKKVEVKQTSAEKTITLSNTGKADLTKIKLTVTGTNKGDFAIERSSDCAATLAAGKNCKINVTFTPKAMCDREATLTVASNATTSPDEIALKGTGVDEEGQATDCVATTTDATTTDANEPTTIEEGQPVAELAMTSLDFGSQVIETTSTEQAVTLKNTGTADLSDIDLAITGAQADEFGNPSSTCSTLAPTEECVINMTFTPMDTGERTATLTINSNAEPISMTLMGTGVGENEAVVKLTPNTVDFGTLTLGNNAEENIALRNEGAVNLTDIVIEMGGDNAGEFEMLTSCSDSLEAGEECIIVVNFAPTDASERTATLTLTSSASSSPDTVTLVGAGQLGDVVLPDYPELGATFAFDGNGNVVEDLAAGLEAGIAVEGGEFTQEAEVTLMLDEAGQPIGESVEISGILTPDPLHSDQTGDVIVIGLYVPEDKMEEDNCNPEIGDFYMMEQSPNGYCSADKTYCNRRANAGDLASVFISLWDEQLANLSALYQDVPLSGPVVLSEESGNPLFKGNFEATGHLCIYIGYRLQDGMLVFNGDSPIKIRIKSQE